MLTLILLYYPVPTHFQKGFQMEHTEKGSTSGNEITKSMRKASNTIIIKLQARVPFQHSFADFPPPNPTTSQHLGQPSLPRCLLISLTPARVRLRKSRQRTQRTPQRPGSRTSANTLRRRKVQQ